MCLSHVYGFNEYVQLYHLYVFILSFGFHTQLCALKLTCHTRLCALQPVYTLHMRVPFEKPVCHTHLAYINTRLYHNSKLKI